jgi:hypothetical protein
VLLLNLSTAGHRHSPEFTGPKRAPGTIRKSIVEAVRRLTAP